MSRSARQFDSVPGHHFTSVDAIAKTAGSWEASLRMRYLGPYALTPDNLHRANAETSINFRGAYRFRKTMLYAEFLNALDEDGKDIVYWYEAHVDGLDPPGTSSADIDCAVVSCRVSRAEEPRTLRVGVKFEF